MSAFLSCAGRAGHIQIISDQIRSGRVVPVSFVCEAVVFGLTPVLLYAFEIGKVRNVSCTVMIRYSLLESRPCTVTIRYSLLGSKPYKVCLCLQLSTGSGDRGKMVQW